MQRMGIFVKKPLTHEDRGYILSVLADVAELADAQASGA